MKGLARSFRHALDGLAYALVSQRNMRIHFAAAFLVVLLCTVLQVPVFEVITVLLSIALVVALELVNTALEHVVNLLSPTHQPHAKFAKDVAAAAVFVASANAVVVAYLMFYDKLDPIRWRPLPSLVRPPFLGVLLVGILFLLVSVTAYAAGRRIRRNEERSGRGHGQ